MAECPQPTCFLAKPAINPSNLKLTLSRKLQKSNSVGIIETASRPKRKASLPSSIADQKLHKESLKQGLKFLDDIGYSDPDKNVTSRRMVSYADFLGKREVHKLIKQLGFIDAVPVYNKLHSAPRKLSLPFLSFPATPLVMDQAAKLKAAFTLRAPRRSKPPKATLNGLRSEFLDYDLSKVQKKSLDILIEKLSHFKRSYDNPTVAHIRHDSPRLTHREMRSIKVFEMRLS